MTEHNFRMDEGRAQETRFCRTRRFQTQDLKRGMRRDSEIESTGALVAKNAMVSEIEIMAVLLAEDPHGFAGREGFNSGPQERNEENFGDREPRRLWRQRMSWFRRERPPHWQRIPRGFGGHGGGDPRGFGGQVGFGGGREPVIQCGRRQNLSFSNCSRKSQVTDNNIKTIDNTLPGGYAPSPGVIYPTLTMLERRGACHYILQGQSESLFSNPGQEYKCLQTNEERVKELFERLEEAGRGFQRGRSPEIMKAFKNLHGAVVAHSCTWDRGTGTNQQNRRRLLSIPPAKAIDEL